MGVPLVAVSLKMYFDRPRTVAYCQAMAEIAHTHEAVAAERVRLAVLPDFLTLGQAAMALRGTAAILGAQDLCHEDRGAFTGEVSGADLAELGCRCVEVGHAERRIIFGENDAMVAAKTHAAIRNTLVPLLCVGEAERTVPKAAAEACAAQVESALGGAVEPPRHLWLAYEPHWAIGAARPAAPDYVRAVCHHLRTRLAHSDDLAILYGGSAGPGLLTQLQDSVDGLFLGRFAHDPAAVAAVVDEAAELPDARRLA